MSRGLESLIPKKGKTETTNLSQKEGVFWIEVNKISTNPYQPRKVFNELELNSLADSIKKYGVLQPLIVSKFERDGEVFYELVAGERRFRACQLLNFDKVPALIKNPSKQEKLEVALIENVQRADLNALDRAEAFLLLKTDFGLVEQEIAKIAGKSRELVFNTLRLLKLDETIKEALRAEMISEGHARAIVSLEGYEDQKLFLKKTIEEGWTVRKLEHAIRDFKKPKPVRKITDKVVIEQYENTFKTFFEHENIKVKGGKKGYQVMLNFKDEEDMKKWMKGLR